MPNQIHLIHSVSQFWSILPSRAEAILNIYENLPEDYLTQVAKIRHENRVQRRQELKNRTSVEKSSGESRFANRVDANGVLTLNLAGEIVSSRSSMGDYFGTPEIALDVLDNVLMQAKTDPYVRALSILIDSPGGISIPSRNTSDIIENFGKPVFALITDTAASAGYDLISGALKIYALPNHISGSIGTMTSLVNSSKRDEMQGIKKLYFASGKMKLVGAPDETGEIPKEHLDSIQAFVDKLGGQFVDTVARRRDLSASQKADIAKADIYVGEESVKAGLVDKLVSYEDYQQEVAAYMSGKRAMPKSKILKKEGKNTMPKPEQSDEDAIINDPSDILELNDDAQDAPVVQQQVLETPEQLNARNSALLATLNASNISTVEQLQQTLNLAKVGESARNALVATVQKYQTIVDGVQCTDKFDDLSYDRLMQLGSSLRSQAIRNGSIEEKPARATADGSTLVREPGDSATPTSPTAKVPMEVLINEQKNRLLGKSN